jgi:hypothetical protein
MVALVMAAGAHAAVAEEARVPAPSGARQKLQTGSGDISATHAWELRTRDAEALLPTPWSPNPQAEQDAAQVLTPAAQADAGTRPDRRKGAVAFAKYFGGGAVAFGVHEGGHVLFGKLFGATPGIKKVHFGPLPFFAITQDGYLSPREQYVVSSAGFWTQHLTSEAILSMRPNLRHQRAPLLKGMLAFDILASVAYASAAFAEQGPYERDTRGMSAELRVSERWVGGLILAPALLDAWRYLHPESKWAVWLSRGIKIGGVVLVVR